MAAGRGPMRVEVVSSRGQIAKRTGWALRLLITQSFGNIVRTRLVSPLAQAQPWWCAVVATQEKEGNLACVWHCVYPRRRAHNEFFVPSNVFPTPLRQKKTPEIKRICLQTRCHHGIRYKGLRCPLYWIVPPRSPNFNVANEFGRPTRAETVVFCLAGQ